MTCVVGLVDNGHIYIGADSYCRTRWDGGHIMAEPKVFHRGPFIIGGCGRTRDSQLLEYALTVPRRYEGQDTIHYMCTSFGDAIRACIRNAGNLTVDKSEESMHSSFLVGYDGQLFEIGCDFSVLHVSEPYLATGSGWAFASGALHSMASLPPKERITKALEAAAHYNCYVRPPFTILSDTDDT